MYINIFAYSQFFFLINFSIYLALVKMIIFLLIYITNTYSFFKVSSCSSYNNLLIMTTNNDLSVTLYQNFE